MLREVWFGTKGYMQWVPAPAVDISAGKTGMSGAANFLNGGAWVRRSKASAKRYTLSWNMKTRAEVQPILDYVDGIYGDGFVYYLDPFAMDRNIIPAYWATPFINAYDGPVIVDRIRPELAPTSAMNGYPVESARYRITSTSSVPSLYVPIPPNHTLWLGHAATVESGVVNVTVTPDTGTAQNLTAVSMSSNQWWSTSFNGDATPGITLTLTSTSLGVIRLTGIMGQILPNGAVPAPSAFISGQGSSGMSFANTASVSQYSAALDRVGVSVELVETEPWAWR
jgi:hypothetical protein